MRVLWVYDSLSVQLQRLANQLADCWDVSLEIMCRYGETRPAVASSVPLTPLVCRSKLDAQARRRIRQKVASGHFDIVHAYTSRNLANVLGACRGLRPRPKIVGYRGTINRLRVLDPANWMTFWHPRLSHVTCVCDAVRDALQDSGLDPSRLSVVKEGCDPDALPHASCSRAEFGIPDDAVVVGAVANMRRGKGIHLLLEAALELADLTDIYWLLIGEVRDPHVARLAADPRIADRVRLPGPRPEGGRYTSLLDIYGSPSLMEGLSMSIMEAMAKQVCPVVSDAGGNIELIRDGVEGLVHPAGDSSALARAIRTLHGRPELRHKLAAAARVRAASEFSVAQWAARLAGVYRQLAAASAAQAA